MEPGTLGGVPISNARVSPDLNVHGDIRPPNVLHTASGYMIIDFDWAGRTDADEPPRYPLSRNHADINWPEDSTAGGIITTNHDRWMQNQS